MQILVTNDDGIHAPGLIALAEALQELGSVAVVAPDRERSAAGHSLTLHHPLRAWELRKGWFAIDGTPTDCVNLGIHHLLPIKPDLVVSGINRGSNLGDDITYSGTVSAAMEATLMGIPALAVSLASLAEDASYAAASVCALRLAKAVMAHGLPTDTLLNVNVPSLPLSELKAPRFTSQGKREFLGNVIDKLDPRGRKYYWIGSMEQRFLDIEGTDYYAVSRGHVSITPLHLDLTNYQSLNRLREWTLPWPSDV